MDVLKTSESFKLLGRSVPKTLTTSGGYSMTHFVLGVAESPRSTVS